MELFGVISVPAYVVVSLVVGLLTFIHYRCNYTYFSRLGINGPTPIPFIGTFYYFYTKGLLKMDTFMIKRYGKIVGLYEGGYPTLLTSDEDILRDVMVKEFSSFTNRKPFLPVGDDVMGSMLTLLQDDDWKRVRSTLTPTFSAGKLKQMSRSVNSCAEILIQNLGQFADQDEEFEVKELMGAFTLDVIARTGFGIAINSQTDKNDEFLVNAKEAMNFGAGNPLFLLSLLFPKFAPIGKKLGASFIKPKVVDFFTKIVDQTMEGRKSGDRTHQDFVQLMVNAHKDEFDASEVAKEVAEGGDVFEKTKQNPKALSKVEILSQGFVLFLAGYDTTANGLTWLLYFLAMNPECQEKVQEEIDSIVGDKKDISYDDVNAMTYLHQCFNESTRIYPAVPRVDRLVSQDVTVKGIPLRKGDVVAISILGRHMDPEIWPEPEKFDPDRFGPEEKARHSPFDHMPFGYGPRNCIAMRLALLEVKLAAAHVLKHFSLIATENTKKPIRFKKIQMVAEDGVWMKLERRN